MKLKSFFANTIEEAIRQARLEWGPDALLVNSKPSGVEARHLGLYEVVACGEGGEMRAKDSERGHEGRLGLRTAVFRAVASTVPVDKLSRDVSELKQLMEKLALTLARSARGIASIAFAPELSRVLTTLTDGELDTELAYDVVGKLTSPIPEGALRAELANLVSVDAALGSRGAPGCVVASAGFQVLETAGALEPAEDLANVLAAHHPGIDTHLVLPASMRAADLRRVSEQYSIFHPRKLLFTRLDETETFGPILSLSIRLGIPVSFLSCLSRGQRIAEDLEPASVDRLLDFILASAAPADLKFDVVAA